MTGREELVEQVVRLLDIRLLDPLEVLLEGDDAVDALRQLVRIRAGRWADALHGPDERAATLTVARLIATIYPGDQPFDPPADWWRTPLGRTIARRVGHPSAHSVSYGTAGAMLGISRQGVHDLVRRGRLPRHPDGGVPASAIRDRLRRRPDPSTELTELPYDPSTELAKLAGDPSAQHDPSTDVAELAGDEDKSDERPDDEQHRP